MAKKESKVYLVIVDALSKSGERRIKTKDMHIYRNRKDAVKYMHEVVRRAESYACDSCSESERMGEPIISDKDGIARVNWTGRHWLIVQVKEKKLR